MEEEYEVPSPHERMVEEETEKEGNRLAQKIALITAVLAAITVLTKRTWLLWGSVGSAGIGLAAALSTIFMH